MGADERQRNAAAGARNLLTACARIRPGEHLLLIAEPPGLGVYDEALPPFIAREAERLGAYVEIVRPDLAEGPDMVPASLLERIGAADHSIFLSRIGDVLRFHPLPGTGSKTMCYALDLDLLGSAFGTMPQAFLLEVRRRLIARLATARRYTIQSASGTDLAMTLPDENRYGQNDDFTVQTFPVMIVPPIPASALSGRMVLGHALTSTSIHLYDDAVIPLGSAITLDIEQGRIVAIEGDQPLAATIRAQFMRVAALFGGEALAVNSWHAGINAETYFPRPALSDIDRWSAISFGSPRYLHVHMCGDAPGDICGQMFDCDVSFDDVPVWKNGRLVFLDQPENADLFDAFPDVTIPAQPYPLGIS